MARCWWTIAPRLHALVVSPLKLTGVHGLYSGWWAQVSLQWVHSAEERRATCVDLDRSVLDWGTAHNLQAVSASTRDRIEVVCADVLAPPSTLPLFDVICANNYSHQCLKERDQMLW